MFERGKVVLQILTSDIDACPADILSWLKSRWREENFLKYASENYGIDKICDYIASIEANTKIIDNPARKEAKPPSATAEKTLAAAERDLATLIADPAISVAAKNTTLIPAAQRKITAARRKRDAAATARDAIPAKLPANVIDPDAEVALLRAGRRGLQMVLRLLAHNAEHWLSNHLNAYLRDDDEYRAITRQSHHPRPGRNHHLHPGRDHSPARPAPLTPHHPRPGPAHRRDQPHPARHARRPAPHHLPAQRNPRHLTQTAQALPEI